MIEPPKKSFRPAKMADNLQACRYEFKYLVDEATAREIRKFTQTFLDPDEHTRGKGNMGYGVHSL